MCIDFSLDKEGFLTKEELKAKEQECAASCDLENGWWDFRGGECVCYTEDKKGDDIFEGCGAIYCIQGTHCEYGKCVSDDKDDEGVKCDDCASKCEAREGQRLKGTGCGTGGCECYYESDEPQYAEGEGPDDSGTDSSSDDSSSDDSSSDSENKDDSSGSDSGSSDSSDSN